MGNVIAIFKHDLLSLKTSTIAAIVALGLILVPPMYAWFTTLGFWDPYASTSGIKVAIANNDEGYSSTLMPTKIDAGDKIVSSIHENDRFDWVFVDEDQAIEGVESGEYYAAIVIPEDFSKRLMGVFSDDAEKTHIDYYKNEKTNAIAPRITTAGATALENDIDETFTKTVADVALSLMSSLSSFVDGEGVMDYARALDSELTQSIDQLDIALDEIEGFGSLIDTTAGIARSCSSMLSGSDAGIESANGFLKEGNGTLGSSKDALGGIMDELDEASNGLASGYGTVEAAIDKAFDSLEQDPQGAAEVLSSLSSDLSSAIASYGQMKDRMSAMGVSQATLDRMSAVIGALESLKGDIDQASADIRDVAGDVEAERAEVAGKLDSARASIQEMSSGLESEIEQSLDSLEDKLSSVFESTRGISDEVADLAGSTSASTTDVAGDLEDLGASLDKTRDILAQTKQDLSFAQGQLRSAVNSGDVEKVREVIGDDPAAIAGFLSAPTELVEHPVYKMDDNGSSMSAFYTSISLWVGAIFLVALTSTVVRRKEIEGVDGLKPWQAYLGRYGIFMLIALCQALIVCLGNVFFVGVQCEHLGLYLLTGCVCAVVFSNLVYTLAISFGSVGKAIAIIILVMQIGGAGGIFPVELSAPLFQAIYPFLPFAHSMEAFNGCIAGIYGFQYAQSILCLLAFLAASLVLGLVLRRPVIKLNEFVQKKMAETEVLV